jgi:hypothetical protein
VRIDEHSQRLPRRRLGARLDLPASAQARLAILVILVAGCFLACERREITSPRIGENGNTSVRSASGPPAGPGGEPDALAAANRAVRVEVVSVHEAPGLAELETPEGRAFLMVETRWENVHPRQKVSKSKLEGKADRTMGVGALGRGGGADRDEMVEVDVAYKVPKWIDHVYLAADGVAYPVHERSEKLPGGVAPTGALEIPGHGDVVDAALLFLVPDDARHLALRLFDYGYGNVTVPMRGNERRAIGDGGLPRAALGTAVRADLELATVGFELRDSLGGRPAPEGRRWAVVGLAGKSLSSRGGVGNIVEVEPRGNLWLASDGGFLHTPEPRERLRFTPELFQYQELTFAVPASAERFELGVRLSNDVVTLALTDRGPRDMPDPEGRFVDRGVMEVRFLGSRRDGELVVLDLAIVPLAEGRGLEIRPAAQFLLAAGASEVALDSRASGELPHPPPEPFVVPPATPVRFEIAFRTPNAPDALRVRGFEGEGRIDL